MGSYNALDSVAAILQYCNTAGLSYNALDSVATILSIIAV